MKRVKIIVLLCSVVLCATAFHAAEGKPKGGKNRVAILKLYDANKDGKLDKDERARILKDHDANKDGKLDKAERQAFFKAAAEEQGADAEEATVDKPAQTAFEIGEGPVKPKYTFEDWEPVKRTTEEIVLVEETTAKSDKDSWQLKFYRNKAYKCGLSGHHTFVIIEPKSAPGKEAPLWVYFHGGGFGYFEEDGTYMTLKFQNKDTYNHEESFETLSKVNAGKPVFKDGRFVDADTTLARRVKEGYRMLVIGYGDHDNYSGKGTPYPNNPKGGTVNGLQASMSAVEYTVANYPTTHVFAHGTSAGSTGTHSLCFAFAREGIHLTGAVMDSSIITPRRTPINLAMAANDSKIAPKRAVDILIRDNKDGWLGATRGQIAKMGQMVDPEYPFYPEAAVAAGYREVPMLVIAGKSDPFHGARAPRIPEAKAAGLNNCEWMFDGLRQAIEDQKDSPHQLLIVPGGHVPTAKKDGHPVHDQVDAFIKRVTSGGAAYPFARAEVK